jgi:putative transposase
LFGRVGRARSPATAIATRPKPTPPTSRAFIAWAQRHHIRHLHIEPGKPMQNGRIES